MTAILSAAKLISILLICLAAAIAATAATYAFAGNAAQHHAVASSRGANPNPFEE
jgi:hypothetical protein